MNPFLLISLLFGFISVVSGQSVEDQQRLIQMSIDLNELNSYYQAGQNGGKKPLLICDNGKIPKNLNLTKFGVSVEFLTRNELFFFDHKAYLEFDEFRISSTTAEVVFRYPIEGLIVTVTFEKKKNQWSINSKELQEI